MQDGCLHQVESEWMSELFSAKCLYPRWQISRWLPSSSLSDWMSLSESQSGVRVFLSESERRKQAVWIQDGSGWIQHGRIQDGCHYQVESEWMSEVFFCANGGNQSWQVWVTMRGSNKMAESKIAKFKMVELKIASIIKLGENKWVWVRLN